MGIIMLDFQWNSMVEGNGFKELAKPMYDKKMWDDNGSWFEPPKFRDVLDIALEVVGNATGQKWVGWLDDALFATTDLTGGYKSAEEVGLALGKKALTTVVSAGMGAASNYLGDLAGEALQGASKFANFAAQSGISMGTNYVTSVANSAVNSFYIGENGLAFNTDGFTKSLYSADTISGALGAGITGGMGALNLRDGNNITLNSKTFNTNGIKALNGLAGGLVQNGVALAMGGNANFNLLSFKGVGMLEFSFGKDGIKSKIGMGGTNISMQNLVGAFGGATNLHKNSQINNIGYDKTTLDALRSQWGFGDEVAKKQLEEIIKRDTILKFDAEGSEVAQSITENGQKIIHLNSSQNNGFIDLGLTLQHEAYRDGIVSDAQSQFIETANAVAGHTVMALAMANDKLYTKDMLNHISSDTNLQNDINAYMYAAYTGNTSLFAGYVGANYDSSADYWKFTKEGNIYWDGSDNLYDEDGKLLHEYSGKGSGHTYALAEALGITHAEAERLLTENADYKWDSEKKTFVDSNGNDVKNDSSKAAITSDMIKVRYDFQHNYVDKLNGAPMHSAVMAFQNDMILGNQNIKLSSEFYKSNEYFDFIVNSFAFANEYDKAMEKYGNVGNNKITNEIYENIMTQASFQSNENILYQYLEEGTISPVVGKSSITTKALYGAGLEYLGIQKGDLHSKLGVAVDLGTNNQKLPVVSLFPSDFLVNNSYGYTPGGGNNIGLYVEEHKIYYKHLYENSIAYASMYNLNNYAEKAGIWSFSIPSNYQIGNVGNSGEKTTGIHLHMEIQKWR